MINDIYFEMRKILEAHGYANGNFFGAEYFDEKIFQHLESSDLNNEKGISFVDRFRDVVSDPNNLFIKRCSDAGKLEGDTITLHNNIKVYNNCYYDSFTDLLRINKGVHEPLEERMFMKVLPFIKEDGVMIELGSYWAFYSIWFLTEKKKGKSFCIEPNRRCLESGKRNFKLNNLKGDFTEGFIGENKITIDEFCKRKSIFSFKKPIEYIDILHSDIQGHEFEMLQGAAHLIKNKKIKYIFISTHSNQIHSDCISFLTENGYRIICSADYENETFSYDGFILACEKDNLEIAETKAGNRKKTHLISKDHFSRIISELALTGPIYA